MEATNDESIVSTPKMTIGQKLQAKLHSRTSSGAAALAPLVMPVQGQQIQNTDESKVMPSKKLLSSDGRELVCIPLEPVSAQVSGINKHKQCVIFCFEESTR